MNRNDHPRILVAGAGGQLGRRVVEQLHASGYTNLVAGSRYPDKLQSIKEIGIEIRQTDFNDPNGLAAAFHGIDRLLLISTDTLHTPGLRIRQHLNAVEAAQQASITHIVYTSMPNPDTSLAIPFATDHSATEQALEESGLGFTILRVSWYADNLLGFLPQILAAGRWPTVAGTGTIAYIPRDDVARVTAAALVTPQTSATYDITGTQALTIYDIAAIAQDMFSRPVEVVSLEENQLAAELAAIGIPEAFVPTVMMTDLNTKAGQFSIVTNAVQTLTGHKPQSLRDFLSRQKHRFLPVG